MTQETATQNIKNQLKHTIKKRKIEELKSKPMYGQFYWELERTSTGKEKSLVWLCSSGLKGETKSLIITAQDQALTIYHQTNITMQQTASKCSLCYTAEEHIKHTVARCTTHVPSEYTHRHNRLHPLDDM
jgi:hypothetical protein